MEQKQQVFFSIKRSVDTIDGQVINYLHTNPFDLGVLPEIVMLTLKEYWSPFALSGLGVDSEELRQRALWSIKQLERQAALMREMFVSPQLAQIEPVKTAVIMKNTPLNNHENTKVAQGLVSTDDQTGDEENDDLMNVEIPEDVQQVNKLFGVE